jgi:hypothetical protein
MLKLNGVGRLSLRLAPTGLALGTRRLHYAWGIVTIASRSLFLPWKRCLLVWLSDGQRLASRYGAICCATFTP